MWLLCRLYNDWAVLSPYSQKIYVHFFTLFYFSIPHYFALVLFLPCFSCSMFFFKLFTLLLFIFTFLWVGIIFLLFLTVWWMTWSLFPQKLFKTSNEVPLPEDYTPALCRNNLCTENYHPLLAYYLTNVFVVKNVKE